ncbi:hypothetical protein [Pengzhenrongella phosphoraccumulans]|uniref:hypothetical protein n=1 Tax=Pengzhenrongella phosphoraccumulans TaxID=3114394 RepID=UPI0038908513
MEMCDLLPLSPACAVAGVAGNVAGSTAGGVLDAVGQGIARGAASVMDAVFGAISTTSTLDLGASYVARNAAALASVAAILVVGLFVVQVAMAAVRQEPGGLLRAVIGAGGALLGAAVAATVTQSLLLAVDGICDALAGMAGTSIEAAARSLLDVSLLMNLGTMSGGGSALMIVFGLLFIVGAVLTLGTLLVREALIVVAVVVAPLAFAGGTARITTGWVRRWVQVTLALVLSKLAIVVVFIVAVGMVGQRTGLGALMSGLILLLLACLAPWACFKFLDFAGTAVASEFHRATNGATLAAVHQGRTSAQSMMRTVAPIVGGAAGGSAGAAGARGAGGSRAATGGAPLPGGLAPSSAPAIAVSTGPPRGRSGASTPGFVPDPPAGTSRAARPAAQSSKES